MVTLSTTEAEYVAGCDPVKETLPIREQTIERFGQIIEKSISIKVADMHLNKKLLANYRAVGPKSNKKLSTP